MKRFATIALTLWLFMMVFEGALRYALATAGVPGAIYAKDILLALMAGVFVLYSVATLRMNRVMLVTLIVLAYGAAMAWWHGLAFAQIAFGLKVCLTFLVGFLAVDVLGIERSILRRAFRIVVPIVLIGLVCDMLLELPWEGYAYEAFGQSIEGSRTWHMSDLARLAGFGRASFETAAILFCLTALYISDRTASEDRLSPWLKTYDFLLILLSFGGILVTTAKTSATGFVALALVLVLWKLWRENPAGFGPVFGGLTRLAFVGLSCYALVPPILAATHPGLITRMLQTNNVVFNILASSYVERMERMWPEAYRLLGDGHMILTGRGVGGIGTAQLYFEPSRINAADNLFVYLLVSFGIVIAGAVALVLLRYALSLQSRERGAVFFVTLAVIGFHFGATMNVIESPALMMTAGLALAFWQRVRDESVTPEVIVSPLSRRVSPEDYTPVP